VDVRSARAFRVRTPRFVCVEANALRVAAVALVALSSLGSGGCAGVFFDLHATGYPALHTAERPTDGVLPEGPKPLDQVKAGVALGFTVGLEIDDGRTSRWAVGYSADAIESAGGASARHRFNDLRLDVTLKTFDDDNRLRVGVGGGIGAGKTRLPRDDGGTYSSGSGSAVVYSGPVFVHYVGNHSALAALVGGSFLIIGAGDWNVRGWGLTTHLTYSYSFDDSHPDVTLYRAVPPDVTVADFVVAGAKLGCNARLAEDSEEEVPAAYLSCGDEKMEIHAPEELLHVHCERSTMARCRALFSRLEEALQKSCPPPTKK
jgi:hypothetical protein